MAYRGNESPMDFQYENHGPADPTSPFHQFAMSNAKKRSHSQFNSPPKPIFSPSKFSNNNAASVFSKPFTETSYKDTSFTTPRKAFDIDTDFSSADPSPAQQTENESPEAKPLPPLPVEFKSKPDKRNSLFGFYGKWAPSSGKDVLKRPTNDNLSKRVHKRRRQGDTFERRLARARRESEETSDDEPSPRKQQHPVEEVGLMTSLFTFIHRYPDAPSIITKYLQVFFNGMILFGTLYVIWSFWSTIKADVDRASENAIQDVLVEMAQCAKNYVENRCEPDKRLPALETVCTNWELCMNRDANAVKRASLSAHTFAEIFNSFVEPISLKTMIFTVVAIGMALLINNATFSHFRRSYEASHDFRHPSASYMYPGQQAISMGQIAMTPGMPYGGQVEHHWQARQNTEQQLDYAGSPSRSLRSRSRSPEKKRLALEN